MHILAVLCGHFTKKQNNIIEFPSLSGDSKHVCEHVGNAGFKKATYSFDKSFNFAACADYYLLLAVYTSSFSGGKKCIYRSHWRTVRCHFCKGEGQAFYMAIKNANRKTLLNFAPFFFGPNSRISKSSQR